MASFVSIPFSNWQIQQKIDISDGTMKNGRRYRWPEIVRTEFRHISRYIVIHIKALDDQSTKPFLSGFFVRFPNRSLAVINFTFGCALVPFVWLEKHWSCGFIELWTCDAIKPDSISSENRFLFEFRSGSAEFDWRMDHLDEIGVLDRKNRLVSVICHYWGIAQKNPTNKESEMSKFSRNCIFDLAVDEIQGKMRENRIFLR